MPDPDAEGGLIKLDVRVTDKEGRPVRGLGAGNFTVLDNGKPAKILSFSAFHGNAAPSLPGPEIVVLIDELDLPGMLAAQAREQLQAFLRMDQGHLVFPVSIFVTQPNWVRLLAGPSADGNALAAELMQQPKRQASQPNQMLWSAPIYDDLVRDGRATGLSSLKALASVAAEERQRPGKKILIWIGPGAGIGSGAYYDWVNDQKQLFDFGTWFSTLLREGRISLFNLSVGKIDAQQSTYIDFLKGVDSPRHARFGDISRDVLAVQSGGGVPTPSNDLAGEIARCVHTADVFYTLSFDPSAATRTDEYHSLKVQLNEPGLTAVTNTGYYDQPFYHYQPNPNARRMAVAELERLLQNIERKRDGEIARVLSDLQLSERLSASNLSAWLARLRGEHAQQALILLADMSAFLPRPAADLAGDSQPSAEEQRQILTQAESYVQHTLPRLPNFYARRTTTRYLETSSFDERNEKVDVHPLHLLDESRATVLYRGGREVVDAQGKARDKPKLNAPDFSTYGTFGPALGLLGDILVNAEHMIWSRWEQTTHGRRAVFRFDVVQNQSRYLVGGCCLPEGDGQRAFRKFAAYDGEIAIDPTTGAVVRLQIEADLRNDLPFARSDVTVFYGPVDIGGQTYICPVKSVSIWGARSVRSVAEWNASFRTYGPYWTMVSQYTFDQFHVFRSTARILTDGSAADPH